MYIKFYLLAKVSTDGALSWSSFSEPRLRLLLLLYGFEESIKFVRYWRSCTLRGISLDKFFESGLFGLLLALCIFFRRSIYELAPRFSCWAKKACRDNFHIYIYIGTWKRKNKWKNKDCASQPNSVLKLQSWWRYLFFKLVFHSLFDSHKNFVYAMFVHALCALYFSTKISAYSSVP